MGDGFDKLTTDAGEGWQIALALQAVVFLLSGIFVGIITDSFGQLRQEEAELRKARESYIAN